MSKKNEVVVKNEVPYDIALAAELGFDSSKNFEGGATPRLPVAKIAHQAQIYKYGDENLEEIAGYILNYQYVNAWWEKSFDEVGGGSLPDCASSNGRVPTQGDKTQSKDCASCPKNQWGSDPKGGNGKACQNKVRLHIKRGDELLPLRLVVPSTSIKPWEEYLTLISNKKVPYQIVSTTLGLAKATSKNIEYSTMTFKMGEVVKEKAVMEELKAIIDQCSKQFGDEIMTDEMTEAAAPGDSEVDYD